MFEAPDHYHLKYGGTVCYHEDYGWVYVADVDRDGGCVINIYNPTDQSVNSKIAHCSKIVYKRPEPGWRITPAGESMILKRKLAKQFRVGICRNNHLAKYDPFRGWGNVDTMATLRILNEPNAMYQPKHKQMLDAYDGIGILSKNLYIDIDNHVIWRSVAVGDRVGNTLCVQEAVFQEVKDVVELPFFNGQYKVAQL